MKESEIKINLERIISRMESQGLLVSRKKFSNLDNTYFRHSDIVELMYSYSENEPVLDSEKEKSLDDFRALYQKWLSSPDLIEKFSVELRNFSDPKSIDILNSILNKVKLGYSTEIDAHRRMSKKNNMISLERAILSCFQCEYTRFQSSLSNQVRSLHPTYLKIRTFYEHLTFSYAKKEKERRIEGCYHDHWKRRLDYSNSCECVHCGIEKRCFQKDAPIDPYDRKCERCGQVYFR